MKRKGTKDSEIFEVLETVNFIRDRMVTKTEFESFRSQTAQNFAAVNNRLTSIEHEIRNINRRLDRLEEQFSNIKGVTKEIDELRGRIKVIERHLKVKA